MIFILVRLPQGHYLIVQHLVREQSSVVNRSGVLLGVCARTEAAGVEVFGAAELIAWLGVVPAWGVVVGVGRLLVVEGWTIVETLQ